MSIRLHYATNIACWMHFYNWKVSLNNIMDDTKEAGWEGIEFFFYRRFLKENNWNDEDLLVGLSKRNLKLVDIYESTDYDNPAKREEILKMTEEHALLLKKFDAGTFLIGASRRKHPPEEKDFEVLSDCFNQLGKLLKKYGINLGIHNHYNSMVETPDEIDKIMEMTDEDYVGFCPDVGHIRIGGGDEVEVFERHKDRINFVHFKDVKGGKAQRGEDWVRRVRPLGQGDIDFPALMKILKEIEYEGWIVSDPDHAQISPLQTYKESKKYIDTVLNKIYQ